MESFKCYVYHSINSNKNDENYIYTNYTKQRAHINTIQQQIERQSGSFTEKVKKVLATKLVKATNIRYSANSISFQSRSRGRIIVPLIVEIPHIK